MSTQQTKLWSSMSSVELGAGRQNTREIPMYLLHRWYGPKAVGVLSVRDTGNDPIDWHSEVVTSAHDRPDIRLCTRVMVRARPSWCIQVPGAVVRKRIPEVRVVVLDVIIENLQQPVTDLEDAANRNIVNRPGTFWSPMNC